MGSSTRRHSTIESPAETIAVLRAIARNLRLKSSSGQIKIGLEARQARLGE